MGLTLYLKHLTTSLTFISGWNSFHTKTYPLWDTFSKCSFQFCLLEGRFLTSAFFFLYGDTSELIVGKLKEPSRERISHFAGHTHGSKGIKYERQPHGTLKWKPKAIHQGKDLHAAWKSSPLGLITPLSQSFLSLLTPFATTSIYPTLTKVERKCKIFFSNQIY